jgi:protein-tyrosine-phosphatase
MPESAPPRRVVFVCVANSCRSQMAEAFARALGQGRWEVWSAGSHPSGRVHPLAVQVMAERGFDLSSHRSKGLAELPPQQWDCVVTMGCGDACPTLAARRRIDWDIPDPVGRPIEEARSIRDRIEALVRRLLVG